MTRLAGVGCRLLLAGVWLYAGASKLGDLNGSVRTVKAYRVLPNSAADWVGAALPIVEIGLALLLLVGLATRVAAAASALLLAGFVVGISSAWTRGLRIDCGCFGGGGDLAAGEPLAYTHWTWSGTGCSCSPPFLVIWPRTIWSLDAWLSGSDDRVPVH